MEQRTDTKPAGRKLGDDGTGREVIDTSGSYGADENYFSSMMRTSGHDEKLILVLQNIFTNTKMTNDRMGKLTEEIHKQREEIENLKGMYLVILDNFFSTTNEAILGLLEKIKSTSNNDASREEVRNELEESLQEIKNKLAVFDIEQFSRTVGNQRVVDMLKDMDEGLISYTKVILDNLQIVDTNNELRLLEAKELILSAITRLKSEQKAIKKEISLTQNSVARGNKQTQKRFDNLPKPKSRGGRALYE